jgi:UDP-N-acetylenolpyruvoylglucosamine reductase
MSAAGNAVLRGELRRHEPMAAHCSWRVGGPADIYYVPAGSADLRAFLAQLPPLMPVTLLGLGSNLLVRDGGIRGAVIATHGALSGLDRTGEDDGARGGRARVRQARARVHAVGTRACRVFRRHPGHGRRRARDERGRLWR